MILMLILFKLRPPLLNNKKILKNGVKGKTKVILLQKLLNKLTTKNLQLSNRLYNK